MVFLSGATAGGRTQDLGLKRPLLYQLSYRRIVRGSIDTVDILSKIIHSLTFFYPLFSHYLCREYNPVQRLSQASTEKLQLITPYILTVSISSFKVDPWSVKRYGTCYLGTPSSAG